MPSQEPSETQAKSSQAAGADQSENKVVSKVGELGEPVELEKSGDDVDDKNKSSQDDAPSTVGDDDVVAITIDDQCEKDKVELASNSAAQLQDAGDAISVDLQDKNDKLDDMDVLQKRSLDGTNDGAAAPPPVKLLEPTGYFRIGVAILTLSSILLANMNRQAFNQALTEMIIPRGQERRDENDNRLDWTNTQAGELKSAFSMGYAIFMIPSARLGEIMGTKWIVFASTFGSGLCSALVPYLAHHNHFKILKMSRFFMGLCQAGVAPALFAIVSRWLSPDESGIFLPLIKGGVSFGLLLGTGAVGLFSWEASFYVCGGVALVKAAFWAFYVTSLPEQNKFLSKPELEYIQQQMQLRDGTKEKERPEDRESLQHEAESGERARKQSGLPHYRRVIWQEARLWGRIFLNWPVAGIMLVKWTMRLSTDAQTQYLAEFFHHVHHLSKGDNSTVNCINYAIQGVLTIHVVWLVNYCLTNRSFNLNKTGIRRLFQCACSFGMAASYMVVTFDLESLNVSLVAVVMLALTNIMQSGADSMMPYDLSPTYSGTIMGVANSFANSAGVLLPKIVGATVGEEIHVLKNWRNLFWVVSALIASGGFIFILLVKAKVQPFDPAYEQSRLMAKLDRETRATKRQEVHIEMSQLKNAKNGDKNASKQVGEQVATQQMPGTSQSTFSEWRAARRNTPEPTAAVSSKDP